MNLKELLVVIAVIAFLCGLIIPKVMKEKDAQRMIENHTYRMTVESVEYLENDTRSAHVHAMILRDTLTGARYLCLTEGGIVKLDEPKTEKP